MKNITIPKKLLGKGDLIIIPLDEYKKLTALRDKGSFTLTPTQKKALEKARKNLKKGKALSYDEFKKRLEIKN